MVFDFQPFFVVEHSCDALLPLVHDVGMHQYRREGWESKCLTASKDNKDDSSGVAYGLMSIPFVETGAGHAFAQAAFFYEGLFQLLNLLAQQITGYADQADDDVGGDRGV